MQRLPNNPLKRKHGTSLDALLKATATGTEQLNPIDKALGTTADRVMKANINFVKTVTISDSDHKNLTEFNVLQPTIEAEMESARKMKELGTIPTERGYRIEPLPSAYFKCKKIFNKNRNIIT